MRQAPVYLCNACAIRCRVRFGRQLGMLVEQEAFFRQWMRDLQSIEMRWLGGLMEMHPDYAACQKAADAAGVCACGAAGVSWSVRTAEYQRSWDPPSCPCLSGNQTGEVRGLLKMGSTYGVKE